MHYTQIGAILLYIMSTFVYCAVNSFVFLAKEHCECRNVTLIKFILYYLDKNKTATLSKCRARNPRHLFCIFVLFAE